MQNEEIVVTELQAQDVVYSQDKASIDMQISTAKAYPRNVKRALEKHNPFEVWGNGKQTRDFIHIDDIVDSVIASLDNPPNGPTNLGTGVATSFLELAQMSMDAVGYKGEIVTRPDKPVGCMHRVSDNSKLLSFYTPKISLERGIWEAVNSK
jgi:GDP-L-fucose synthase